MGATIKDDDALRCPDCGNLGNNLKERAGGANLYMCSGPGCYLMFDHNRRLWTLNIKGKYLMGRECPKCETVGEYRNNSILQCPKCQTYFDIKLQLYEFQGKHLVRAGEGAPKKEKKEEKSVPKIIDELRVLIPSSGRMLELLKDKNPNKLSKEIDFHQSYVYKLCQEYGLTREDWEVKVKPAVKSVENTKPVENADALPIQIIEQEPVSGESIIVETKPAIQPTVVRSEPPAEYNAKPVKSVKNDSDSKITLRDALKLKEELAKDLNCATKLLKNPTSHLTPGVEKVVRDYIAQAEEKLARIDRFFDEITVDI
ncbi:MAG: hypothetical protein ACYDG6_06850 [Thermincolia bacterium]